jgi:hypothetical protein
VLSAVYILDDFQCVFIEGIGRFFLSSKGVESLPISKEGGMKKRLSAFVTVGLLLAGPALAKGKGDKVLPPYILQAHTVAVVIDPGAGIDPEDPRANQVAQKDVETALMNWGRFQPVMGTVEADLIIVIRKGHGRMADATISDPRQNDRAGVINPTDSGIGVGAQRGSQPNLGGSDGARYPQGATPSPGSAPPPQSQVPTPQLEVGGAEDWFVVYEGKVAKPLNGTPGWRYVAPDGLHSHNVPAVEAFRKAVAAGEKAAAAAAAKKP